MGTSGPGLYESDFASDLKAVVTSVLRVPKPGDELVAIIDHVVGGDSLSANERTVYWLVIADQFEKKGISSDRASRAALDVIASGEDLDGLRGVGADDRFIAKREKILGELRKRLLAPRKQRIPRVSKLPPMVLSRGSVYSFRTMSGRAWHPYRVQSEGPFVPDGWGAMVVLEEGRAFQWIPWLAIAGLGVSPSTQPTLEAALEARIIAHPQTNGVGRYIPKPAHAKGLGLARVGSVALDAKRVAPHLSSWPLHRAVQFDWTIAYGALTRSVLSGREPTGPILSSLMRSGGVA